MQNLQLGPTSGGRSLAKFRQFRRTKYAVTHAMAWNKSPNDADNLDYGFSSDPNYLWYWNVGMVTPIEGFAFTAFSWFYQVKITYYCRVYERTSLVQT